MSLKKRAEVEIYVIEQIVEGIKDVPATLSRKGFRGTEITINALLLVAARYAVHLKKHDYKGRDVDWNDVADEITAQFRHDLEENFSYYYNQEG